METDRRGNPDPEGNPARRAELDGRGEFQQTAQEHEAKERVSASDGRGLLPALPPRNKAPVGPSCLQTGFAGQETSPDCQRESAAYALGASQRRIKGFIGGLLPASRCLRDLDCLWRHRGTKLFDESSSRVVLDDFGSSGTRERMRSCMKH